jgi:hypothetical protein
MTPADASPGLEDCGYTPRQAAFLRLVLLFGGYFVRRQATTFFGGGDGGVTTDFVRTLVARGHATCGSYGRKTQVVHVFAKRLYAALGEPDNRNRRAVEPATILRKLLTLDLVLAHRHDHFLATTREKTAYFERVGVPLRALPTTHFHARRHPGPPTIRHFVDKAPIYVSEDGRRVTVAYVRTPIEGVDGFRTWLAAYAPLLALLRAPCLILVTTSDAEAAESLAAANAALRTMTVSNPLTVADRPASLERYYEARLRAEFADPSGALVEKPSHRGPIPGQDADPALEPLYREYRCWGPVVLHDRAPIPSVLHLTHVTTQPEVMPVRYGLFGTQHRRRPRGPSPQGHPRMDGFDVSATSAA